MKKTLKIIGIVIVAIIAIPLVIALFINGNYAVEKEVVINKSKQEVFEYIKILENQDNFSTWSNMDPDMKKEFIGTDGTVGFISAWESENEDVGKGEQEIMKISEGARIDYELRFMEPFEATDLAYMTTESISENETKVKWGFTGKMKYPMNLMLLFMNMEEMLGQSLQDGLNKLKTILETQKSVEEVVPTM